MNGSNGCFELDGIRWANDWYLPPGQRTDYRVEVWQPADGSQIGGLHTNPSSLVPVDLAPGIPGTQYIYDADQRGGAPPLEMADAFWCTASSITAMKIMATTISTRILLRLITTNTPTSTLMSTITTQDISIEKLLRFCR